jgi:hypothetical protein
MQLLRYSKLQRRGRDSPRRDGPSAHAAEIGHYRLSARGFQPFSGAQARGLAARLQHKYKLAGQHGGRDCAR